ncbi:MAG TPA: hypothetical protein DDY52_01490 [Candidatus Moranbacteria bacterium]|nr:hypothetical protein [Candidatus Moranbacteria bacterium]
MRSNVSFIKLHLAHRSFFSINLPSGFLLRFSFYFFCFIFLFSQFLLISHQGISFWLYYYFFFFLFPGFFFYNFF